MTWFIGSLIALFMWGTGLFPWKREIAEVISGLAKSLPPAAPALIALIFLKDPVGKIILDLWNRIAGSLQKVLTGIGILVTLLLIVPIMVADTLLLGPWAHAMWKDQVGTLLLIGLSGFALFIVSLHGEKLGFAKKFFAAAILLGIGILVWDYFSPGWTNTTRMIFTIKHGKVVSDPAASIPVKPEDVITFTVNGYVDTKEGDRYSPAGNVEDPVNNRPRGELMLRVLRPGANPVSVPLRNIESGPETIAEFDLSELIGGYYFSGQARIPEGAQGRLSIMFHELQPAKGSIRAKVGVNTHRSFVGKMMAMKGYTAVLHATLFALILLGVTGVLAQWFLPKEGWGVARGIAYGAAVVVFIATLGAASKAAPDAKPGKFLGEAIGELTTGPPPKLPVPHAHGAIASMMDPTGPAFLELTCNEVARRIPVGIYLQPGEIATITPVGGREELWPFIKDTRVIDQLRERYIRRLIAGDLPHLQEIEIRVEGSPVAPPTTFRPGMTRVQIQNDSPDRTFHYLASPKCERWRNNDIVVLRAEVAAKTKKASAP